MMTLDQLEAALEIVRHRCPWLPVLAIRWMHLKHPLHPVQHHLLDERGETEWSADAFDRCTWKGLRWIRPLLAHRLMQCVIYLVSVCARLVCVRLAVRRQAVALKRQRFTLVLKTCGFGPAQTAGGHDFYFGDLQQRLTGRGFRTLLLCGDAQGTNWVRFAAHQISDGALARFPEQALLSPATPFRLMAQQLLASIRLRLLAARTADPLIKHIYQLASKDCLMPDTARAALYFWIGKAVARTWHPSALVTLYEGHAWELCLRWGVKAVSPLCRTVGYQHTVLFPESRALLAPSNPTSHRVVPDIVLAQGPAAQALMRPGHAKSGALVVPFGSFRAQPVMAKRTADPRRRVILVTPEGLASEVRALFAFVVACAPRLSGYRFILRCHPELPEVGARKLVAADWAAYPNIQWSVQQRIEEDFSQSSAILYRGSSVALYAVGHGLLPIYLQVPTMWDSDSLHQVPSWHRRCATPGDLAETLAAHERASGDQREAEWAEAGAYVARCATPVEESGIEALMAAVSAA